MKIEGKGVRVYKPQANSLRAKLLQFYAANPTTFLTRQDIMEKFGVGYSAIDRPIEWMKQEGIIQALFDSNGIVSYGSTAPKVEIAPTLKPRKPNRTVQRQWPSKSTYMEPKPIVNSVWQLAEMA